MPGHGSPTLALRVPTAPMPLVAVVLLIASLSGAGVARAAATIEGTVVLPRRDAVPASKPRYPVSASYAIGDPDPPTAIVYLEGDFPPAGTAGAAEVAQRQYQFAPGLIAVQRGAVVRFPNQDDEYHSVFSYSQTKSFDLGRFRKDEAPAAVTFDQAGVVKLYCEIHDHMRGTILVLDTPHFTKTDPEGRYRLAGVPEGSYVLKAWIDEDTVRSAPVTLGSDGTVRVDLPALP